MKALKQAQQDDKVRLMREGRIRKAEERKAEAERQEREKQEAENDPIKQLNEIKKEETKRAAQETVNNHYEHLNLKKIKEIEKEKWEIETIQKKRQRGELFNGDGDNGDNGDNDNDDDYDDEDENPKEKGKYYMAGMLVDRVTKNVLDWVDKKNQQAGFLPNPQQAGNVQNPQQTGNVQNSGRPYATAWGGDNVPSEMLQRRTPQNQPIQQTQGQEQIQEPQQEQIQEQEQPQQVNKNSIKTFMGFIPRLFTQEQLEPLINSLSPYQIEFFNSYGIDVNQFLEAKAENKG